MRKRLWTFGGVLGAVLLLMGVPAAAEQNDAVFEMEEFSVFEQGPSAGPELMALAVSGQHVLCDSIRQGEVKKYPELKSSQPIYGSVTFGQVPTEPKSGVRFFFVIDESEPDEAQAGRSETLLKGLASALAGTPDRSGANRKYDRLYFDLNGDLDLTNDAVVKPMKAPPQLVSSREVVFDYLEVPFDQGPGLETRTLKILPRLRGYVSGRAYVTFTAAAARKGKVKLGGREFTALLAQTNVITGRFDAPYTGLILLPDDPSRRVLRTWSSLDYLSTLRWVGGEYYQFAATPTGDKLTVSPYRGETGLLKVSPGGRTGIEKVGLSGVLRSQRMMVPVGDVSSMPPAEKLPEHKVPVGDYTPMSLSVDFGKYTVSLSENYYAKEEPHAQITQPPAGSVKIRKDKPFVLDFSSKPAVLFISPPQKQTFKPGDSIYLRAAIIDPELNLLVRGLDDTSQKIRERTYMISAGNPVTIPQYASLAPTVTITDASGKQVAQGTMPFG
jgi:hypothetical protein